MITKQPGFVINRIQYSESSIIVRVFTRDLGLKSFLVQGVRKKKAKTKANLFQPLSLVEITFRYRESANMHRANTCSLSTTYSSIPYDFLKSSQAIFLAELLYKSLHESDPHIDLFDWLRIHLVWFDGSDEGVSNFHLFAGWHITRFLGIMPETGSDHYFDLLNGNFTYENTGQYSVDKEYGDAVKYFLSTSFEDMHELKLNRQTRQILLDQLIMYYQLHLEGVREIKSKTVLQEVMDTL
jgi:DNA repair protein RecO (recombination protein O)